MLASFTLSSVATALLGGALIGASASLLLGLNGRVAGVSGILAGMFDPRSDERGWQRLFIAGLLVGGIGFSWLRPSAIAPDAARPLAATVLAGVLVGIGTRLGGGCTSGHGVCGVSRLSPRSLTATAIFLGMGMLTVLVTRHVWPGWGTSP